MGQNRATNRGRRTDACNQDGSQRGAAAVAGAGIILAYDTMTVSCLQCSNWAEFSGSDPRRRADGYGFHFNADGDAQDFTCVACGCKAEDRYFVTGKCDKCAEPDEREVTDEILAALGRHSV